MAGETVLVGCKAPTGLVLNLDAYEVLSKEHGTVREVKSKIGPFTLRGNSFEVGKFPKLANGAFLANEQLEDGYVFTPVPKDFWDEWSRRNADSSLVKDRIVIAVGNKGAAEGRAREHETERGLSPRLTENDPRVRILGVRKYDGKEEAA